MAKKTDFVEVTVVGLVALSPGTSSDVATILIPRKGDEKKSLTIFIGLLEAMAIFHALQGVKTTRPFTHDLYLGMLRNFSSLKIEKVKITELRDNTYYALIKGLCNKKEVEIDCRPSDAIAIALKSSVPIFANTKLLSEPTTLSDGPFSSIEEFNKYTDQFAQQHGEAKDA